jgi:hypothetical protein
MPAETRLELVGLDARAQTTRLSALARDPFWFVHRYEGTTASKL